MRAIDKVGSAFLRRILRRMKELGVSQSELAARMHVSRPYITKVLRQDVNFSFRTAAKLANALKMDFFPELRPQEPAERSAPQRQFQTLDSRPSSSQFLTKNFSLPH